MNDADLLRSLGVDPAALDPAPATLRTVDARQRFGQPCSTCGAKAISTGTVDLPQSSFWLDSCRDHMLEAFRLRAGRWPAGGDVCTVLREAAAEAGVALTVITDREAG
ncbi:hypothetical protein ABT076_10405 [Streptomyces sp. NPDC002131]|uniref:hypothetical protein n=1 Tax=Streptomyces sp. NPDC002131 TaxID=3154535 RepID=UPI003318B09B